MDVGRLLAATHALKGDECFPIVLVVDEIIEEWKVRLNEGVIHDLILRSTDVSYMRLRLDIALRNHLALRELEVLREKVAVDIQKDSTTGVYNRDAILSMLFRETDRVQRMRTPLCLVLFRINDFDLLNANLGMDACHILLREVVARTTRLLRSYDLLGRASNDEFLVVLPGCRVINATMLAERLRLDLFGTPIKVSGEEIQLSACFAIDYSEGRSPVVALHEAELALQQARSTGPDTIQIVGARSEPAPIPGAYLSHDSCEEMATW
jgi:diguanylate cyclase (GGDEF)-like protein